MCFRAHGVRLLSNLLKSSSINRQRISASINGRRYLFSAQKLGLEPFCRERMETMRKLDDVRELFVTRMEDYLTHNVQQTENRIYHTDLHAMLYLAETDREVTLMEAMVRRYHKQNPQKRLPAGLPADKREFTFDPVVLRLYHELGQTDKAYSMYMDKDLAGFFSSLVSHVIMMDLLFDAGQYERVLEVMDHVLQCCLDTYMYDCETIALATCLKLNTPESYARVKSIQQRTVAAGKNLTPRGIVYAAMVALKQGHSSDALDILTSRPDQRPFPLQSVAMKNLKVMVYAHTGRVADALHCLHQQTDNRLPQRDAQLPSVFKETLTTVQAAVANDVARSSQLSAIEKRLYAAGLITTASFMDYIFTPDVSKRVHRSRDSYKYRHRHVRMPITTSPT